NRYSSTCLKYRKRCKKGCAGPGKTCPAYIPDFVKLAESYGALGIRVTSREEVEAAFHYAAQNELAPTLIEFIIEPEENVLPIVPPGSQLSEMIMEY
ncbi:MAG: acetolactate synthase large subunit, partial [Paenibacillaceae bacterium]|nr:acetolactate synthase large subunit [Paenibacillaceae bacterium]